jgi:Ca-activated chloride channel homolog
MQLSLRTDRRLLRAGARSTRYLMISLTAPVAAPRAGRLPVNVGIVLDRSGSMDGERKFALAREAVEQSLRMLRPEDRFTLVVYDGEVDILVASSRASRESKRLAVQRLADVCPRGSTNLHGGWTIGAGELAAHLTAESVNRILLLTDGLANEGLTEPALLAAQAAEFRRCGIATSTFGVGEDFDERLLRDIAHEGGGQFYFIETPRQIPDLLTSELGEALEVVVRGAALRIALPAGAEAELLNRYRFSRADGDNELHVELGDLTSGQEASVVVRVKFAAGADRDEAAIQAGVTSGEPMRQEADGEIRWTYATHAENDVQPRDRDVDREVAALYAARARAEATEANRHGDFGRARRVLERTAKRIRAYAAADAELEALWRALLAEVEHFAERPMSAMELKSAFFVAESARRGRGPEGKARRARPGPPR